MDIAKHWKTIINTLRDGLLVVDPNGVIRAVNTAAERLTGYSKDELVGSSCLILGCTGCKIRDENPEGQWCGLFTEGKVQAKNCMITQKNQRSVHILKNAVILYDSDGEVIGAVETLSDMSDVYRQQQEIELLRKSCKLDGGFHGIIGESPPVQRMFELIESVGQSDAPVLILGQSGTGKELAAKAIHDSSLRKDNPFIKVNCAALNENLLESELFGHVKGAYTGADRTRMGRFEAAHGGTILLDEIGDIPLLTQVKLLRVLEEREIERVGDHRQIPIDVRIITATNKNLEKLIDKGDFREDLFFRINVFPITCPGLSERSEDIPMIVQNFIDTHNDKTGKSISGLTSEAMEILMAYTWPGNVRELRNAIDYAFVLCSGKWIGKEHLPPKIVYEKESSPGPVIESRDYKLEREKLIRILKETGGNQSETARLLNVSRVTIWKRIKKYNINLDSVVS